MPSDDLPHRRIQNSTSQHTSQQLSLSSVQRRLPVRRWRSARAPLAVASESSDEAETDAENESPFFVYSGLPERPVTSRVSR